MGLNQQLIKVAALEKENAELKAKLRAYESPDAGVDTETDTENDNDE